MLLLNTKTKRNAYEEVADDDNRWCQYDTSEDELYWSVSAYILNFRFIAILSTIYTIIVSQIFGNASPIDDL